MPLSIPPSTNTISIQIVNNGSYITHMRGHDYMDPVLPGHETLNGPIYIFLLHHAPTNTRLLFDLGNRTDWREAYPPGALEQFKKSGEENHVKRDLVDVLKEGGVAPEEIDGVIYSHHHLDHTGDTSPFPRSTRIIVGPGYKDEYLPGWPEDPDEDETTSDLYQNRDVHELDFTSCGGPIGGFRSLDYFNDGSLYFLDTPGHTTGHLSALARTTSSEGGSTFMLIGGDIVSSNPVIRPSPNAPLPDRIPISSNGNPVSAEWLLASLRSHSSGAFKDVSADKPFCNVAGEEDRDLSQRNAEKLQAFDADEDVLVVWAHDDHLRDVIEYFPRTTNEWKEKGWKENAHWRWLEPTVKALREEQEKQKHVAMELKGS